MISETDSTLNEENVLTSSKPEGAFTNKEDIELKPKERISMKKSLRDIEEKEEFTIEEGQSFKLRCLVQANPPVSSVNWAIEVGFILT